jgi:pimeloyl-ACP methyl ester carboxylesterase
MSAILLHSTGTLPTMWDAAIGSVPARAVTHLGYPPHPPIPRGVEVDRAAEVAHVLTAIGDEDDVDLVAHSYGGMIALDVGDALGARLRSLALYEPVLFGALASPELAEVGRFLTDTRIGGTDPWLERFIDFWNRPGAWARMPPELADYCRRVGWKMFCEVRACFSPTQTWDHACLGRVPVTLIAGARTPAPSRAVTDELARRYPAARVVVVPGTGHMGPITHPALVAPVLAAHFAALR